MSSRRALVAAISGMLLVAACNGGGSERDAGAADGGKAGSGAADAGTGGATLSREKLLDPLTCKGCHPNQYKEWASSMHAYASDDPVFVAMNARGQREAKIGPFCVNCHAPLAVREGYAADGKNLSEIPDHLKGVTCYFCHNVESIDGTHNNPLKLANDTTMRGALDKPLRPTAHGVAYSALVDGNKLGDSSKLCGSCHDIENGHGVQLERTYSEWQSSFYSKPTGDQSCGNCHMEGYDGIAADVRGLLLPTRRVHRHLFAGVDLALTPFNDQPAQRVATECKLSTAVRVSICPNPDASFEISLETNAGHRFPSGAGQDRRAWLEFVAYDDKDKVIFQSGVVTEGEVVEKAKGAAGFDPNLWVLRDRVFDAKGDEALMFWDADKSAAHPNGYESSSLPETQQAGMMHTVARTYRLTKLPARVRVQLHVQPIGREVLDSLVASKDLDATLATKMPTLTLTGTISEWKATQGFSQCVTNAQPDTLSCPNDYLCLLYPDLAQCQSK